MNDHAGTSVELLPINDLPEFRPGDDLAAAIAAAAPWLRDDDVLVVTSKVFSKVEGRLVDVPTDPAGREAARRALVMSEAVRVVAKFNNFVITENNLGIVQAASGVDASNVALGWVTVLPREPDVSADRLREALSGAFECPVGVIVADTFGRPWREGLVNVALGVAGLRPLIDYRGCVDSYGRQLESTVVALADEIASAAEIVMRKTAGMPVAIVRGAEEWAGQGSAQMLVRDAAHDLFR